MYRIGQREAKIPQVIVAERSTARSYVHIKTRESCSLNYGKRNSTPGPKFFVCNAQGPRPRVSISRAPYQLSQARTTSLKHHVESEG